MGKPDVALKQWLQNKVRFADLFNGIIFYGEQIIKPEELVQVNGEANIILKDKDRNTHFKQRFRDLIMQWHGVSLVLLAVENQQGVNYAMPARTMLYDSMNYSEQIKLLWKQKSKEEKKVLDKDEYFSHFSKEDSLTPIITIVFYYGENASWDGPVKLHDMFAIDRSNKKLVRAIERFVPNYHINLLDVSNIPDISRFKSDLHLVLGMLEYRKDREKLQRYVLKHKGYLSRMDSDTRYATEVLLNANKTFMKLLDDNTTDGGKTDMCEALEQLQKYGEERGDILRLISQIQNKVNKCKPLDIIADELEDTVENLKPLYDAVMEYGADKTKEEIYQYYLHKGEQ